MSYWIRANGWWVGVRCIIATTFGPLFWPAWLIAPKWKRDKWHRIACDDPHCEECDVYYADIEAADFPEYHAALEEYDL